MEILRRTRLVSKQLFVTTAAALGNSPTKNPNVPWMMHFGEQDDHISLDEVDLVRKAHPSGVEIFTYSAGHGFNCDERPEF